MRSLARVLMVIVFAAGTAAADPGREVEVDRSAADDLYMKDRPPTPEPALSAVLARMRDERVEQRDDKRTEAIGMLRDFLASDPGPDTEADAMFKLAELLWEDAERDLVARMDAYDRAAEACRRDGCATQPAIPRIDLREAEQLYRELLAAHPDFRRADLVTYLIGFAAREDGREADAIAYFTAVVDSYPDSPVAPDAWMMIGEHHFAGEDWTAARDAYRRVLDDPELGPLALFKTAWTDWKLGAIDTAAREFGTMLAHCDDAAARKTGMCDEAVDSLLSIFTEDRQATAQEVHDFLTSVGGDAYATRVLAKVGERYTSQSEYERAADVYGYLIEQAPDAVGAAAWQRAIVDGWNQALDAGKAQAAIGVLLDRYGPASAWATARRDRPDDHDAIAQSLAETERLVRTTAKNLHADAQAREHADRCKVAAPFVALAAGVRRCRAEVVAQFATAADAYARYLDAYGRDTRDAPAAAVEARYLRGQILYLKLGKLEAAGDELMAVARTAPVGAYHKAALETAMDAYERARPPGATLTSVDKKFGAALELYASLFPGKDVAGLLYRNGKMFFDHGMYDHAVQRWQVMVDTYPREADTAAAADGILDAKNRSGDFAGLEQSARQFKQLAAYAGKAQQMRLDGLIVQSMAKQGDAFADAGRFEAAAKTYVRLHDEFPANPQAAEKLMNAAVMFEKAKRPERAGETYLAVATQHPKAAIAAKAAFAAGQAYEGVASFDRAAAAYEVIAKQFRNSAVAADAVFNAGRLRQALGQYKQAIAHYQDYAAHFGTQAGAAKVAFNVGVVYELAGRDGDAEAAFARYLDAYGAGDKRAIEANVRAGRAAFANGRDRTAGDFFAAALKLYKKGGPGGLWAAEAQYQKGELIYRRFAAVALDVTPAALTRNLKKKLDLLAAAKAEYDVVAAYDEPAWSTAALFKNGSIYDRFADELAAAPLPAGLSPDDAQAYQAGIDATVIKCQGLAKQQYETGLAVAKKKSLYDHNTTAIVRALSRLDPVAYPPEHEARSPVRVGDRPLTPTIVTDVKR